MREPKPFFRSQTKSWYVQFGKQQINLGRNEKKAWEKYHELMAERRKGVVSADDALVTVLNRYLVWVRDNRAKDTYDKKLRHLRSFGRCVGPKLKVSELKAYHVQRWIDQEYAGRSDTYQHIAISEIQTALNWAVSLQYIAENPIAKMPKPEPGMREFFVPAEGWSEILAAIPDREFSDYVIVSVTSGARPQEMPKIEARHFDRKHRRIVFSKKESKGKKRSRVIYLPDEAFEIVDRLAKRYPSGPIFRNTKGRPWSKDSVNGRFKRLKKKLGMPKLCATVLRHSWAHHQLVTGTDSHIVSKLMGHVDGRMLAERYGHIDQNPEFMLNQANRISGLPLGPPIEAPPDFVADAGQDQPV
jgi:integrase